MKCNKIVCGESVVSTWMESPMAGLKMISMSRREREQRCYSGAVPRRVNVRRPESHQKSGPSLVADLRFGCSEILIPA